MRFVSGLSGCLLCLLAWGQQPPMVPPNDTKQLPLVRLDQGLLPPIPSGWDYTKLGAFCKLDVQLERRVGFPVFIRLGDVQRVEQWEGKGAYRFLTP